MSTLEKLSHYKASLSKWAADRIAGHVYDEPKPYDYGLKSATDKFMAKKAREEILGR